MKEKEQKPSMRATEKAEAGTSPLYPISPVFSPDQNLQCFLQISFFVLKKSQFSNNRFMTPRCRKSYSLSWVGGVSQFFSLFKKKNAFSFLFYVFNNVGFLLL